VPRSIIAFLEADGFEDAVGNAISLGGDADTMACIAGGIAEAFFGDVPEEIAALTPTALDERLRGIVSEFLDTFADRRTPRFI
jgi:ADP-ribosylglycohydrolase